MTDYRSLMFAHYESTWGSVEAEVRWLRGPRHRIGDLDGFSVLVFAPNDKHRLWTYATQQLSSLGSKGPTIELHLFAPAESLSQVELLTVIAHYHRTEHPLGLGHTVNFGRPWVPGSMCDFGLVSVPYVDGPKLQRLASPIEASCYWLLPITMAERDYKKTNGLEALEQRFQDAPLDYANPTRGSVV